MAWKSGPPAWNCPPYSCRCRSARAGAGSLVPITGFANAVVSAAIEFKTEGRVLGTGAKMFTIAGPVIVYGTLAAVVYGAALWVCGLLA